MSTIYQHPSDTGLGNDADHDQTGVMSVRTEHATGLYIDGIRDGNARTAVEAHIGERYTQHSTGVADGREGFLEFFEPFLERNPQREIELVRVLDDGRYVFVHAAQTLGGTTKWVTTDLFDTDSDGRVVEHWDVIAPGGLTSPSGHTQTDGETRVTDLHRSEENKKVVSEFATQVLLGGHADRVKEFISSDSYVQHNPNVADGLDGFAAFLTSGVQMRYVTVHKTVAQGNFVAMLSEVELDGTAMAVFDLFRLDGGLIVEHWDNMEAVPAAEQARNSGKF